MTAGFTSTDITATLLAELTDALVVTDKAGTIVHWSAGAETLFGHLAADATGANLRDLVVPANLHGEHAQVLQEVAQAGQYTFEALRRHKNGSLLYVDGSGKIIRSPEGRVPLFLFSYKDATPLRVRRDAKLVAAKYQNLLESTPDAILMLNPTGHIVFLNSQAERLFGYDPGELHGKAIEILLPQRFRERHIEHRSNFFLQPRPRSMGAGLELYGVRKDGREFAVEISLSPLQMDDVSLVMSAIRDISDRIAAERKFRGLLEAAPDAIVIVKSDGEITLVNSQTENMFGYNRTELLGQKVEILLPHRFRAAHPGRRGQFFADPKVRPMGAGLQLYGMRKDGREFPVEISLSPLETEDGILVTGAIRDLTERKHVERTLQLAQAQKMETVGQLTGGIAHDFNNLLTVITANGEDVCEALVNQPDLHRQAEMIMQAAARGAGLVRQLLAYARKQELHPRVIELNTLVEASVDMLRRTLPEDLTIEWVKGANVPMIHVDVGSLENAILNLALNARDAMPGGGTLTIETSATAVDAEPGAENADLTPGAYALLSITDDGPGMKKNVLERAFEPFFTTKEVGKGSGLGLSMVYGFVKQSGGHIKIYSEPGLGTSIKILLPKAPEQDTRPAAPAEDSGPAGRAGASILLVEDDELVRSSVTAKLRRLGYTVTPAANGPSALSMLETSRFDMVLTDVIMPGGMSGADLARRVLERWPSTRVLATSGYTESTLLGKIDIPANVRLLSKPYSNAELRRAVAETLDP